MKNTHLARRLRSAMTPAETLLWSLLRHHSLGNKVRRQVPMGPYILDFVCLECRLIVEVDGSQHANSHSDAERDAWCMAQGFRVLRFWNQEVLGEPDAVLRVIRAALPGDPHPV
jgi:very-short-patch-repair endonuclease